VQCARPWLAVVAVLLVVLVPPPQLAVELGRSWIAWRLRHRTLTPAQVLAEQRRPPGS
jgi:hypothetical protein